MLNLETHIVSLGNRWNVTRISDTEEMFTILAQKKEACAFNMGMEVSKGILVWALKPGVFNISYSPLLRWMCRVEAQGV